MQQTLQGSLWEQFENKPHLPALGFYSDTGEQSWFTYAQLRDCALAHAAWLANHGVDQGDVCLLVLPSARPCAMLLLGALLRGAIPLLMAPPTPQRELASRMDDLNRVIRRSRARLVIADATMMPMRDQFCGRPERTLFLHEVEPTSEQNVVRTPTATDVAAYQLTSGTTGLPRICVWRQRSVTAALRGMAAAMKIREGDRCVNWTPLYHDMGLVNNFFFCLTQGVPLTMLNPLDFVRKPVVWLRALTDTDSTMTWSPNFGFAITAQRVRDAELDGVRLDHVRAFWNAAERIHLETIEAFHERFASWGVARHALKTNFGCAENVGGATFSDPDGTFRFDRVDVDRLQTRRLARPPPGGADAARSTTIVGVGRPCPDIKIQILSRTGQPLAEGRVGEVALDTPSRMLEYLGEAKETKRARFGSLLRTGDLGYLRDGELFWVGRVRERVTIRGRKLDPSDFEPALLTVSGLRHGCFVAFGVDDVKRGTQRVVIVTEVRDPAWGGNAEIPGEIRERVFSQLGVNVDDVVLVRTGTLTKTTSGKRRHRHFRRMYMDGRLESIQAGPGACEPTDGR